MTQPARRSTMRPPPPARPLYVVDGDFEEWRVSAVRRRNRMGLLFAILGVLGSFAAASALQWVLVGQAILLGVSTFCFSYITALMVHRGRG